MVAAVIIDAFLLPSIHNITRAIPFPCDSAMSQPSKTDLLCFPFFCSIANRVPSFYSVTG